MNKLIGIIMVLSIFSVIITSGCTQVAQQEMEKKVSKSFTIPSGGSYCIEGKINVLIVNTGTETIGKNEFKIKVDNIDASKGLEGDIEPEKTGKFLWNCGNSCTSGLHEITLKTVSSTQTLNVVC